MVLVETIKDASLGTGIVTIRRQMQGVGHNKGNIHKAQVVTDIDMLINNVYMTNIFKMDNLIKVVSYNCRGFPKSPAKLSLKPTVDLLLNDESIDIICMQETFLSNQDLSCLNVIHKDYQGIGTSTVDTRDGLVKGHPSGGVAILYRTKQAKCITPLYFNLDWVIGICINNDKFKKDKNNHFNSLSFHISRLCLFLFFE